MAEDQEELEYIKRLLANYERNKAYAKEGEYFTTLNPASEAKFRAWVKKNKVPFDPKAKITDYDMRGFWQALQMGDPRATTGINPNDKMLHYPDQWKTPYHQTFSSISQWAGPGAPVWNKQDQLVLPNGSIVFDEKAEAAKREAAKQAAQAATKMAPPMVSQPPAQPIMPPKVLNGPPY